jgi:hypothetical protein
MPLEEDELEVVAVTPLLEPLELLAPGPGSVQANKNNDSTRLSASFNFSI